MNNSSRMRAAWFLSLVLFVGVWLFIPNTTPTASAQIPTLVTVTASPNSPAACNTTETFTATIGLVPQSPNRKPSQPGTAQFFDGANPISGALPLSGEPSTAQVSLTLAPGNRTITAIYTSSSTDFGNSQGQISYVVLACAPAPAPSEVPEGDTLLLLGGGLGGLTTWLAWQWRKVRRSK